MIKLEHMDQSAFQFLSGQATRDYTDDKIKAGAWDREMAMKLSEQAITSSLSRGLNTDGAYLYSIVEISSETQVGYIWLNVMEGRSGREAFIYDFYIFEPYESNGYGNLAMIQLDEKAREMNITKIGLHVFGHNRAFELYQKMGYVVTDITMSKDL